MHPAGSVIVFTVVLWAWVWIAHMARPWSTRRARLGGILVLCFGLWLSGGRAFGLNLPPWKPATVFEGLLTVAQQLVKP